MAARPGEPEFLARLRIERAELQLKFDKLTEFLKTAPFGALSDHAHDLLATQRGIMISYRDILDKRISLIIRESKKI